MGARSYSLSVRKSSVVSSSFYRLHCLDLYLEKDARVECNFLHHIYVVPKDLQVFSQSAFPKIICARVSSSRRIAVFHIRLVLLLATTSKNPFCLFGTKTYILSCLSSTSKTQFSIDQPS